MSRRDVKLSVTALASVVLAACAGYGGLDEVCRGPSTAIHEVQGAGFTSPLAGERVTVRGVVVGDFQRPDELAGFFLQEPEPDDDPRTSEGLFVATASPDVAAGERVEVTGRVEELGGLTSLTGVLRIVACGVGTIAPAALDLREARDLEPFEGMSVRVVGELTVADSHQLGPRGQLLVAPGGRPFASTNGEAPAPSAGGRRLLIDDGSRTEWPAPPPYLDEDSTRRLGDRVSDLVGVVSEEEGSHVLHPTAPLRFAVANPRSSSPPPVGGALRVAGFNLLNYFTTLGERGASNELELERQRAKLVAVIEATGADVVGLMELENNGDGALLDLVSALNGSAQGSADAAWAHVPDPGGVLGDDAIRLGFIYRPAAVRPIGVATADLDPLFKRPPLAQTFEAASERFVVVVNHFKSKGCGKAAGIEKDAGQGCWNALRTRQAERLLDFVARLRASTGEDRVLVIGDLNAYGAEDPIRTLTGGGLVDQVAAHVPPAERYSYVYRGLAGYLDHAFTTPALAGRVTGAAFWHVNADEPTFLDYNLEHRAPELYRPDPFRSSDHDPVLIGLEF